MVAFRFGLLAYSSDFRRSQSSDRRLDHAQNSPLRVTNGRIFIRPN
jgi:hypothetical protein